MQTLTLNWANIDSVQFTSSGGTPNPDVSSVGSHLAVDNLTFGPTNVVPEPGTYAMLAAGLVGSQTMRRMRRRKA